MSEERFQRDDPERTEPIRDFPNAFQGGAPGGPASGTAAGTTAGMEPPDWLGSDASYGAADPAIQDFVTQGVRKGYELLREQMNRGQQFSEQMWGNAGSTPDLRGIFEQTLYFYSDAMLRWANPFLPPRPPQGGDAASPLPVHVISSRPTRASLKLLLGAAGPFEALPLWARDRAKPPIQDARFVTQRGSGTVLVVRIQDAQPVDLYMGVITSQSTGQPAGVVSVQILAR
jgi:hypothetical protein